MAARRKTVRKTTRKPASRRSHRAGSVPGVDDARYVLFATWGDVLYAARRGETLRYQAPLDRWHSTFTKHDYKVGVRTLRLYPMSRDADPFTADKGHLSRFSRRMSPREYDIHARRTMHRAGSRRRDWAEWSPPDLMREGIDPKDLSILLGVQLPPIARRISGPGENVVWDEHYRKLSDRGLIAWVPIDPTGMSGAYYRITAAGRAILARYAEAYRALHRGPMNRAGSR